MAVKQQLTPKAKAKLREMMLKMLKKPNQEQKNILAEAIKNSSAGRR